MVDVKRLKAYSRIQVWADYPGQYRAKGHGFIKSVEVHHPTVTGCFARLAQSGRR